MHEIYTGKRIKTVDCRHEALKSIVCVAHGLDKENYQYLLEHKKWIKIEKLSQPVGNVCGVHEINNTFYVVGRKGISTLNNEVYEYSSNKQCIWCTSCRVKNNILVLCNFGFALVNCSASKVFDTRNKKFTDSTIKTGRKFFAAVHFQDKVWIVGGWGRGENGTHETLSTIQVYDPVKKTLSLSPVKMTRGRSHHKVIAYKKKLFAFGGRTDNWNLSSVEMYCAGADKFVMMAPMKMARRGFACCRVGNLVYVVGGWVGNPKFTSYSVTRSVEIYDLDANTWTEGPDYPGAAADLHACAVYNKI